ncbi:MAG: 16S rRNA (cytosine(967)-C(5))-methyltransferase RsmB [Xanthomonadales bacterium]|nr:16S rRNA (cytosine(967)-C(5))-methyltransferase RsmB [Xanthomonadales bacterium]
MAKRPQQDPRLAAAWMLSEVLDRGRGLNESDPARLPADPRDAAMARHLAYGVLRWLGALEWLAGRLLERPLRPREREVQRLMFIGLHQLWQDRVPDHAAVHATVAAARTLGKDWAAGLLNAVLRRFQRERDTLLTELEKTPQRHAHPGWLLDRLKADWPDDWPTIVQANNTAAPLWLRVNRLRTTPEAAAAALADAGLEVRRHPVARDALCVEPARPVEQLPGFAEGHLSVQDPAAQLAADLVGPREGMRVLDACAAPGGKTAHLLERAPGAQVHALDRDPARLQRVRDNLERLGLEARVQAADAADPSDWWDGTPFQRVLLDAPCSATGVIRRHPEIKWLRSPEQVDAACAEQDRLLRRLWPVLEAGGILVYATCSVLKAENSQQMNHFLRDHPDAEAIGPDAGWGREQTPGRQVLPGNDHMDGFYYACLRKRS